MICMVEPSKFQNLKAQESLLMSWKWKERDAKIMELVESLFKKWIVSPTLNRHLDWTSPLQQDWRLSLYQGEAENL